MNAIRWMSGVTLNCTKISELKNCSKWNKLVWWLARVDGDDSEQERKRNTDQMRCCTKTEIEGSRLGWSGMQGRHVKSFSLIWEGAWVDNKHKRLNRFTCVMWSACCLSQNCHGAWCWSRPVGQRCTPRLTSSQSENQSLRSWEKPKCSRHVCDLLLST